MEPRTKTCGPIPDLILTHHFGVTFTRMAILGGFPIVETTAISDDHPHPADPVDPLFRPGRVKNGPA